MLPRKFYSRNTKTVAKELLGKILVHKTKQGICKGKIVETEAYFGLNDPGSHACNGPTPRSKIMFENPGVAYVYFTYGNHWMLNFITEKNGEPGAVLIRAVEPLKRMELMKKRRNGKELTNGPAKLTQAFGITGKHNGVDITKGNLYILDSKEKPKIITTTRIGIKKGADLKLRFYIKDNNWVSKK